MSSAVLVLVVISAGLHPLRELFIKGSSTPEGIVFAVTMFFGILSAAHLAFFGADPLSAIQVWPLVLVSGLGVIAYYLCVLSTLRHGDLSIYYPITRSSPLFVVVAGFFLLGHRYDSTLIFGVALVLVGTFLLQYRPGARFLAQPRTLAMAILALCSNGVTYLADAAAMKSAEPVAFLFLQYLFLIPAMAIALIITRPAGRTVYHHLFIGWVQTPFSFFISGITS